MSDLLTKAQATHVRYLEAAEAERAHYDDADTRAVDGQWAAEDVEKNSKLTLATDRFKNHAQRLLDEVDMEKRFDSLAERVTRSAGSGAPSSALASRDLLNKTLREHARMAPGQAGSIETEGRGLKASFRGGAGSQIESRTITTGGDGSGVIPRTMISELYNLVVEQTAVFELGCRIRTTSGGAPMDVPKKTARASGSKVAENAVIPISNMVTGKVTMGAFGYKQISEITNEQIEDETFDIVGAMTEDLGDVIRDLFGSETILTGNGTTGPQAIIPNAVVGVTGQTGQGGFMASPDQLLDLRWSVIGPHRKNPSTKWLMADSTAGRIRKLKDNDGAYMMQLNPFVRQPATIEGDPVITDPSVPAVALGARSIAYGNFSGYMIRIARGIQIARSTEFKFDQDAIAYRVTMRADGRYIDTTGAVKAFVGGAS
jgi:HK97 family phage major capsid protein